LRKKLRSDVIETLRGVGYILPAAVKPDALLAPGD
jgi:DNA-binding response OmpR family regulator